jgi:hypothetical protein
MRRVRGTGVVLGLGMLLSAPAPSLGQAPVRTPVLTTPNFAFFSDFDTNLNDALIAAGLARKSGKPELFHSGDEEPCFGNLPVSARAAWDRAVDYYKEVVSSSEWDDPPQYLIRVQLAGFDEELREAGDRQFVEIARSIRGAATPAYKACRWIVQDGKNRSWISELKPLLAAEEGKVAPRLEQLYGKRWGGLPIPVDVVEIVNWSGANSILRDPAGGHLLISNSYQDSSALEVVFHEASHLLMDRKDPVQQALSEAAGAAKFRLPGDLWHVVLFYTTGEAVRQILEEDGKPGYTPMLYGIFDRGSSWGRYRKALESAWRPYIDGKQSLSQAAAGLIEAVRKPAEPRPDQGKPKASTRPSP